MIFLYWPKIGWLLSQNKNVTEPCILYKKRHLRMRFQSFLLISFLAGYLTPGSSLPDNSSSRKRCESKNTCGLFHATLAHSFTRIYILWEWKFEYVCLFESKTKLRMFRHKAKKQSSEYIVPVLEASQINYVVNRKNLLKHMTCR